MHVRDSDAGPRAVGPEAPGTVPVTCTFTLPARLAAPWAARSRIRPWLLEHRFPVDLVDDIVYLVSEAVSNSAEHAYPADTDDGTIDIHAEIVRPSPHDQAVRVVVRDHGTWQAVNADPGHRGHGIAAMAATAQELTIRHTEGPGGGTEISALSRPVPRDHAG